MGKMCACGKPLHYSSPYIEEIVCEQVSKLGEEVEVTVAGRTYLVQRHYIALHGLAANKLGELAKNGIIRQIKKS